MLISLPGLVKPRLRYLLGEQALGALDYLRFPYLGGECGSPLNDQKLRQALVLALLEKIAPAAIIETGTYLGATTEFMAKSGLPVYSIEADPRSYGFARVRLRRYRNATLLHGDSRAMLSSLFAGALRDRLDKTVFFYLDAHWNDDLPLAEELGIIFGRCPNAVVMIDDFQVPFDAGYGYDDYGPGKALTFDYIADVVAQNGLHVFYPSTSADQDGGARRGCVVLAKEGAPNRMLEAMDLLRAA